MKRFAVVLLLLLTSSIAGFPQATSADRNISPAERSIARARKMIEKNPEDFEGYNMLAWALSRRARETADAAFYARGEEALEKSFAIAPGNFDGRKIQVLLLLGRREFAAALESAKKLNQQVPDDVMPYGFMADANAGLGNYKEAEVAAQWMLDLRAGNTPGLTRAAYLLSLIHI